MQKIEPGTFNAGIVKSIGKTERFTARNNAFSFMSSVIKTAEYKQFLYDALVMVKQVGIPTHSHILLALSCAELRWK